MKPSDQICNFIMSKEGWSKDAYKPLPTDKPTIGYGSVFYSDGSPVCMGDIIDLKTAQNLFTVTLDALADKLSHITNPKCTQQQFDAVLSLCYNIGFSAFTTSETGIMYSNGSNISNRFLLWDKSAGQTISGLISRRQQEKQIYDNNIFP